MEKEDSSYRLLETSNSMLLEQEELETVAL